MSDSKSSSNPFKQFIEQHKSPPPLTLASMDPFGEVINETNVISPLENSYETGDYFGTSQNHLETNEDQNWLQYLDDETGHLYWYNVVTGESRWLTEEEMQQQQQQFTENANEAYDTNHQQSRGGEGYDYQQTTNDYDQIGDHGTAQYSEADHTAALYQSQSQPTEEMVTDILAGPWEKYYDDDGNPYYYNQETGVSEWEIPADQLQYFTHPANQDYSLNEKTESQGNGNFSPSVKPSSTSVRRIDATPLKTTSSFRSVRSARSLGLLVPPPISTTKPEVSFDDGDRPTSTSSKKLKSKLSFTLKKVPSVNNNLKPVTPSPLKRKSKNGFEMLKEGAKIIQKGKDESGQTWVEFQTAEDGPFFYALEGTAGGQWNRPTVFNPIISHRDDASSVGDHSVELVDSLSEGLLTIKTPIKSEKQKSSSSKNNSVQPLIKAEDAKDKVARPQLHEDKSTAIKSVEKVETLSSEKISKPVQKLDDFNNSSEDKDEINSSPIKLLSKSYVNLGISSIIRTASSKNMISPTKATNEAVKDQTVETHAKAVLDTFTNPNPTANLKIKNIQAEAMAELQKLRDKLNQAKKDFTATAVNPPTPSSTVATPVIKSTATSGIIHSPAETSNKLIPTTTNQAASNAIIETPQQKPAAGATPPIQATASTKIEEKPATPLPPKVLNPDVIVTKAQEDNSVHEGEKQRSNSFLETSQGSSTSTLSQSGTNPASQQLQKSSDKSENVTPFDTARKQNDQQSDKSPQKNGGEKQTLGIAEITLKSATPSSSSGKEFAIGLKPDIAHTPSKGEPSVSANEKIDKKNHQPISAKSQQEQQIENSPADERKSIIINNESYYWDEISPRAHIIQRSANWHCLYDTKLKIRFFQRKETGECQLEKPNDFDTNIELLTTSAPQSAVAASSTASMGTVKAQQEPKIPMTSPPPKVGNNATNMPKPAEKKIVSVAPAVISTNTTPQKPLIKPKTETDTFFTDLELINQQIKKQDHHEPENSDATFPVVDIYNYLERLRKSSTIFQEPKLQESEIYLKRLEVLSSLAGSLDHEETNAKQQKTTKSSAMGMNADNTSFRYTKRVNDMDKEEIRKVRNQCQEILERCCGVLEQIEKSPIEHAYNELTLIQLALQQRAQLTRARDYRHDGHALPFSSKEFSFPSSFLLRKKIEKMSKPIQSMNHVWGLSRIHLPTSSQIHKYLYYHQKKNIYQPGEPFDAICKKQLTNLKKEKWSDFVVYASVPQQRLEEDGIELYSDPYQGYLFYCPRRKLFSSNGQFDYEISERKSKSKTALRRFSLPSSRPVDILAESQFYPNIWNHGDWRDRLISAITVQNSFEQEKRLISNSTTKTKLTNVQAEEERKIAEEKLLQCLSYLPNNSNSNHSSRSSEKIKLSKHKLAIHNLQPDTQHSKVDELQLLSFESQMEKETYQKYHAYLLTIVHDAENPLNYLKIMELLLYEGEGKASLAVLKVVIDAMKSSLNFTTFQFHDSFPYYILSLKLSYKYFYHYERYESILQLAGSFTSSLLNGSGSPSVIAANQSMFSFLFTHLALYLMKLKQYSWAEVFLVDALLYTPHGTFPQLVYAYLLYEKYVLAMALPPLPTVTAQQTRGLSGSVYTVVTNSNEYKTIKKYLLRATQNPSIMATMVNDSRNIPSTAPPASASSVNLSSQFSSSFARVARLQLTWLTELYESENKDERANVTMEYKQCLVHQVSTTSTAGSALPQAGSSWDLANDPRGSIAPSVKADHIQSLAYHSLGKYYQTEKSQYNLAIEYYQKAIDYDGDNYLPYLLYSALSLSIRKNKEYNSVMSWLCSPSLSSTTLQKEIIIQDRTDPARMEDLLFIPSPNKKKLVKKLTEVQTLDLTKTAATVREDRPSSRPSSARLGAATNTFLKSNLNEEKEQTRKISRPKSASSTRSNGVSSTPILPSMIVNIAATPTTIENSKSQKVLPSTRLVEIKPDSSYQTATIRPQSAGSTNITTANPNSSSISSLSLLNQLQIDAYYRRSLLLIDNCSYRWIVLLLYADYLCYQIQDLQRAKEYYEESMKLSFSSNIWPTVAYVYFLQYILNDYEAIPLIFIQWIKSRYPFSLSATAVTASEAAADRTKRSEKFFFFKKFSQYLQDRHIYLQSSRTQSQLQKKLFLTTTNLLTRNQNTTLEEGEGEQDTAASAANKAIYEEISGEEKSQHATMLLVIAQYFFTMKELELCKQYLMESYRYCSTYLPTLRLIAIIHYYEEDLLSAHQFISTAYQYYVNHNNTIASNNNSTGSSSAAFHCPALLKTIALFHTRKYSFHKSIALLEKSFTSATIPTSGGCYLSVRLLGILYSFQLYSSASPAKTSPSYSNWKQLREQYHEKAIQAFSSAYQLSENIDIEALRLQSQLLMNQHQFLEAKVYLLEILQQKNNDIISIINLAICFYYIYYYHPSSAQQHSSSSSSTTASSLFYSSEEQYQNEKQEIGFLVSTITARHANAHPQQKDKDKDRAHSDNAILKLDILYHSKNFYHLFFLAMAFIEEEIARRKEQVKRQKGISSSGGERDREEGEKEEDTESQYEQLIGLACYCNFWFGFIEYEQLNHYIQQKELQQQELQQRELQMEQLSAHHHRSLNLSSINNNSSGSGGIRGGGSDRIDLIEKDPILKQLFINALDCFQKCIEVGNQWSLVPHITKKAASSSSLLLPSPLSYHSFTSQEDYLEKMYLTNYFSHYNTLLPFAYYYLAKLNEDIESNNPIPNFISTIDGSGQPGGEGVGGLHHEGRTDFSKSEEIYLKSLDYTCMNPLTLLQLIQLIQENINGIKRAFQAMKKEQVQLMKQYEYKNTTSSALFDLNEDPGDEVNDRNGNDDDDDDNGEEGEEGKKKKLKSKKKGKKKKTKKVKNQMMMAGSSSRGGGGGGGSNSDYEIDELNYFAPKRSGLFPGDPNSLSSHQQYFAKSLARYDQQKLHSHSNNIAAETEEEEEREEEGEEENENKQLQSKQFFQTLFDVNDFTLNSSSQKKNNHRELSETGGTLGSSQAMGSQGLTMKELLATTAKRSFETSDAVASTGYRPTGSAVSNQRPPIAHQYLNLSLQQSVNQSTLMKRLLMYQRFLDHLLLKKLSYEKLYEEMIFPKGLGGSKSHTHRSTSSASTSISSSPASSVSTGFRHPISFLFLSNDWIDEYFYSFSKCEDWNVLYQSTDVAVN